MRKKIPALTAAIALGTATMTTGAMAFGMAAAVATLAAVARISLAQPIWAASVALVSPAATFAKVGCF